MDKRTKKLITMKLTIDPSDDMSRLWQKIDSEWKDSPTLKIAWRHQYDNIKQTKKW